MHFARLIPILAVLAPLAAPAGAWGDDFNRILQDYKSDGRLDRCYSPSQLHNAERQIPPDIEQYDPAFGAALSSGSGCGGPAPAPAEEEEQAPAVSAGSAGPGTPAAVKRKSIAAPPAPERLPAPILADLPRPNLEPALDGVSGDMPGGLVALLVAAGASLLLALAWGVSWFMGWSPERLTKPLSAAFGSVWDRLSPGR
jgi:hypothetical protein